MARLAVILSLPLVLLSILGWRAVRDEQIRADAELRREAQRLVERNVERLQGVEQAAAMAFPRVAYDPRTATGLPLEPLELRAAFETDKDVAEALRTSILKYPSALSYRLMQDVAASLPAEVAAASLADAREAEKIVERLEMEAGEWRVGEERDGWPEAGDFARFAAEQVAVTSLAKLQREVAARVAPEAGIVQVLVTWRGNVVLPAAGENVWRQSDGDLTIAAVLAQPGVFAAEVRAQILKIAALLGCALLVMVGGAWATWRAFRRQRELAELQSEFIASVSHELRTPVTSIGVLAEQLESGEVDATPEKVAEYHRFIGREGRRLAALVENVLDFSRIEQGRKAYEFDAADLPRLAHEAVDLLRPQAVEKGVDLREEITLGSDDPTPDVDALAVRQALVNLLDNAIKFTPSGGTVTVGLAPGVRIWVRDTGPGVSTSERAKIFERFYRADNGLRRETTGAGIGLSLVRHIVEAHNGTISVDNAEGGGAIFTIELMNGH